MVFAKQIETCLAQLAPKELAYSGDNVGLLIDSKKEITRVLCALDITKDVVNEAIHKKCELIVSHHPVIFRPLYNVKADSVVYTLINSNISAVCMHTNFDAATGGVNDTLSELFKLENVETFGEGLGRIGELEEELSAESFAQMCKNLFGNVRATRYSGNVKKVAVVGGSGSDYMFEAFACGADVYVTGEAAHHCAIAANHDDKLLIAAGHYATEHPAVKKLAQHIQQNFSDIDVLISENECDPFK